jgi:hypothetical protein
MLNPSKEGSSSGTDLRAETARARLREAADQLRAAGVENADECLRFGAAAMAERCLAKYHARQPDVGPGWLAAAVRQGDGFPNATIQVPRHENASDWLRIINGGAA